MLDPIWVRLGPRPLHRGPSFVMSSPRKRRGGQATQLVTAQGLHLGGVHGHSRNAGAHAHMGVVHGCLLGPLAKVGQRLLSFYFPDVPKMILFLRRYCANPIVILIGYSVIQTNI